MHDTADVSLFLGRFHLVLLHLPIGFLMLLAIMETAGRWSAGREARGAVRFILLVTAPVTLATAGLGWLLAERGGYSGSTLEWHRWTGVGVAVLSVVLLWVHWRGRARFYRAMLAATVVLVIVAGHLGGTLTHGSGFLTAHAPAWLKSSGDTAGAEPDTYASVATIFERYCISCHGADRDRGGLRLHAYEDIMAGGDSGEAVVAGDAGASLLIQRMLLPLDDADRMPPEGRPQPVPGDIVRLKAWIDAGAPR